ncbi:MAG TPA: hypothetical protein VIJ14_10020 [Rhabdochlamydiaceae bacterium]
MKNEHDDSKKLILGLLIGGVVGAAALYCIQAARCRKTPFLKKVGRTICDVGEMLENCDINSTADVMETIEKKLPKSADIVNNLTDWVDTGMTLWKKFNKG